MTAPNQKSRQAGGILIALGLMLGALTGVFLGQTSAGLLTGGAIGTALALLMWWKNR